MRQFNGNTRKTNTKKMLQDNSQEVLKEDVTTTEEPLEIVIEMKSLSPDIEWSTSLYESLEDLKGDEEQDQAGCKIMFHQVFCIVILLIIVIGGFVFSIVMYYTFQIEDLPLNDEELKLHYYLIGQQAGTFE